MCLDDHQPLSIVHPRSIFGFAKFAQVKMRDYDYETGIHGKIRPLSRRGQVKATIVASLACSIAWVTSGITSIVKKSLSHQRSTFSGIMSDVASSSFTSHHSLSTRSQASGTCCDVEDYVEDIIDTNNIGHIRICRGHLYS